MANSAFETFREHLLTAQAGFGAFDFLTDTIRAMLVDHADDTPAVATDQDLADIASAARIPAIGSCPALGSKTVGTVAAATADAADTVFPTLSGDQAESLILVKDTGTEGTSLLVAFWDTATGLPILPNGGDVTVGWHPSGILRV